MKFKAVAVDKNSSPFTVMLALPSLDIISPKIIEMRGRLYSFLEFENSNWRWHVDIKKFYKAGKIVNKKIESKTFVLKFERELYKKCKDLLDFTSKIQKTNLKQKTNRELLNLYQKYCRKNPEMYSYGFIPVLADFEHNIKGILKQKLDVQGKLKEIEKEKRLLIKKQQKYLLDIPDLKYRWLFKAARRLMFSKGYRKDVLFISYWHVDRLVQEIAKRLFLTPQQIRHVMPQEMEKALLKHKVNVDLLNERIKHCGIIYKYNKHFCLTGKELKDFITKYIVKEKKISRKIKKILGTPAYPGKTYVTVRYGSH